MKREFYLISIVLVLAQCVVPNSITTGNHIIADEPHYGANTEKIIYNVITGDDAQVLALQGNDIDLIGETVDPSFLDQLSSTENVDVATRERNGYGSMIINCDKYPLNITSFRRALAFALDKEGISENVWEGYSVPLDSCVPDINPFSIENQLGYTYYEENVALGNSLLDEAGFVDIDDDGLREAPDGSEFDVVIECAQSSNIAIECGSYIHSALTVLGVDAVSQPAEFYEYLNRLYFHGDYDIAFIGRSFSDFDVDWLAYQYWSEYADEPYWNFPNWRNSTYDSWRDQLLHSTDYEEVYEAAYEMQKIWVYSCPELICYCNELFSAYRTDKFEGFVNDAGIGVPCWWTNMNAKLKLSEGGPYGGTLRWSNSLDIDTFNFMVSSSSYSWNINQMMWDSLFRYGSDGKDVPWLVESYEIETHDTNAAIPEGNTRFTFNLYDNVTWSDGQPLTGEDVAFTLNYYKVAPGNPYSANLGDMSAAYTPSDYSVIVEFSSESFWHLHSISDKPIIPKHIFENIGINNWNTWNPDPTDPNEDSYVTSGPFNVTEYVAGEFIELTRNPNYFRSIDNIPTVDKMSVNKPNDITYEFDTTGHNLTWSISKGSAELDTYSVYRNGSMFSQGTFNESQTQITIDIDGLQLGTYNFTLVVNDTIGEMVCDTVYVNVIDIHSPVIDGTDDFNYNVGDTGYNICWEIEDSALHFYSVLMNGTEIENGTLTGTSSIVTIDIEGLDVAVYNFTIIVWDTSNNNQSDIVLVTVLPDMFAPTVTSPDDVFYSQGATGNNITWTCTDDNPATYSLYRNGERIRSGQWIDSEPVIISVDGLSAGIYNYTIVVFDQYGNSARDTVFVNVTEPTTPTTSTEPFEIMDILVMSITIGSLLVIVVLIVLIMRNRR